MEFSHFGNKYEGSLEYLRYQNGNLAVQLNLDNGEPYATLSVNTELALADNEFVAKTYSENEGLVEQFVEKGHFIPVSRDAHQVGFAGSQPIMRVSD